MSRAAMQLALDALERPHADAYMDWPAANALRQAIAAPDCLTCANLISNNHDAIYCGLSTKCVYGDRHKQAAAVHLWVKR